MIQALKINPLICWLLFSILTLFGWVQTSYAAGFFEQANTDGPLPVEQAFVLSPSVVKEGVISLDWVIQPDYYLYRDRMEFVLPKGVILADNQRSATELKSDPLFGDVHVFHDSANVVLTFGAEGDEPLLDQVVTVTYQGCWEGGICYPPVKQEVSIPVVPTLTDIAASNASQESAQSSVSPATPTTFTSEQDQFASLLNGQKTSVMLGLFFLAGLALSLTPCVFPMIPILSGVIVGRGEKLSTQKAFMLSLVYVLAMAFTYTVVGVIAGLFGANVQVAFQNPWVIGSFSALFVLLALSMFGFYQLQMPSNVQTWLSKGSDKRSGRYTGVAVMGVLSALIVGPCMAAPLAGALIYIGQSGDPVMGGLALFSLSLGMGLPLLVVGTSAGRYLPKAGVWMDSVKAGFGVVLLLMAVWMLDRIVPITVTMLLLAVILIICAIYLKALESLPHPVSGWQRFWKGIGVLSLLYGAALLVGVFSGSKSLTQPLHMIGGGEAKAVEAAPAITVTTPSQLATTLADLKRNGTPAMLDFYADWCISCKELEWGTFQAEAVVPWFDQVRLIRVDVTDNNEASKQLIDQYKIFGPPALFFYNASGELREDMTTVGVISEDELINRFKAL
jgi:thiol:disulfide interchange protein DsbD